MSTQPQATSATWDDSDDLPDRLGETPTLSFPEKWTLSTAWQRAQEETDHGGPINDAERMVRLSGGDSAHRVTFALKAGDMLAECDCKAHQFNDGWCAHLASLWWRWSRGQLVVTHLDTGRDYPRPPSWLRLDDPDAVDVPTGLTSAELDALLTVDYGEMGVREYARKTDRSPGTVGNLLRWAREKVEGSR